MQNETGNTNSAEMRNIKEGSSQYQIFTKVD